MVTTVTFAASGLAMAPFIHSSFIHVSIWQTVTRQLPFAKACCPEDMAPEIQKETWQRLPEQVSDKGPREADPVEPWQGLSPLSLQRAGHLWLC